jgi:transcription-repair coupling factor (superfamily II helicase)
MVSRFRTKQETKTILDDLTVGKVDVIVGTHRLLSKDVHFKDLGLLVVDEEQRFGVAHKERIKQIRKRVDVLTMTATPIPRTLNMSLVGIRDMSVIETPPKDRLSIQTNVVKFDAPVIERAIRNELGRGGQVYFVHNRVESIFSIGNLLQRLVPEAKVVVGHGQMGEEELERAMLGFVDRKFDVLLATTIVENGLDIPNANTMIINRADRLWSFAAVPVARPCRPIRSTRVRLSVDPARGGTCPRRSQAAGCDQGVQRLRQWVPRRGTRPRDSRCRQSARR